MNRLLLWTSLFVLFGHVWSNTDPDQTFLPLFPIENWPLFSKNRSNMKTEKLSMMVGIIKAVKVGFSEIGYRARGWARERDLNRKTMSKTTFIA